MIRLERPRELVRVREPVLRTWLETQMLDLLGADFAVTFAVLEPGDAVLSGLWEVCWGCPPGPDATLAQWLEVVEYVEEHPAFFTAVVPLHHEADLIVVLPKGPELTPEVRAQLHAVSVNTAPA